MIRFDSAGTELDLPPGSDITVQGQSLVLPASKEGGLTLDQRAMVSCCVYIDCVVTTQAYRFRHWLRPFPVS